MRICAFGPALMPVRLAAKPLVPEDGLLEIASDNQPRRGNFGFGLGSRTVQFSPPAQPRSLERMQADYREYLRDVTHWEGRSDHTVTPDDAHKARGAVRIMRNVLHNDEQREAEMRLLVRRTGDPWHALGIMQMLDEVDPALRTPAREHFLDALTAHVESEGSVSAADLAGLATGITFVYQVMQPGEDFETTSRALTDMVDQVRPFQAGRVVKEQLLAIGKTRDAGEPLASSLTRYHEFHRALEAQGFDSETAANVFRLLGTHREQLLEAVPAHTSAALTAAVRDAAQQAMCTPTLSSRRIPEAIEVALARRRPQESLRDATERTLFDFWLMQDFDGQEKLRQEVEQAIADGRLHGLLDELHAEVDQHLRLGKVLGKSAEDARRDAFRAVEVAHSEGLRQKREVERRQDHLVIGGVKVPLRRGTQAAAGN